MRVIKNIFSQLHSFVLWFLASALFWMWIFNFVTDVSVEKKVTVYCDVPEIRDTALAVTLEEEMPQGLKMIKVHAFSYVMFNMDAIGYGDIYIVPESKIEEYADFFAPEDDGIIVYDASSGTGIAQEYITYGDEDYYLFLGAGSAHIEDGKALEVAQHLLTLD